MTIYLSEDISNMKVNFKKGKKQENESDEIDLDLKINNKDEAEKSSSLIEYYTSLTSENKTYMKVKIDPDCFIDFESIDQYLLKEVIKFEFFSSLEKIVVKK